MDPIIRNLLAIIFIIVAFAIPIASDQADHNLKCVPNEESILLEREGNRTERQSLRRARNNLAGAGSLKIFSQRLKAECKNLAIADLSKYFSSANATPNGCSSQNGTASCCANLNVDFKFVHVHQYVCLNITYFHLSKSIRILVDIDGYAVFQFTLSATNPPPVCLPFMIGELCIKLYKLKADTGVFSGCAGLELYLMHQKVMYIKLGCFNLPFLEERSGIADGSY